MNEHTRTRLGTLVLACTLVLIMLASVSVGVVGAQGIPQQAQNLTQEAREQVPEVDESVRIDSTTIIKEQDWRPGENKVYLTIQADTRTSLTVVDRIKLDNQKVAVPLQKTTIEGEKTVSFRAVARGYGDSGRQTISISTDDTISILESQPSFSLQEQASIPSAVGISTISIILFSLYRLRRQRFFDDYSVYDPFDQDEERKRVGKVKREDVMEKYDGYLGTIKGVYIKLKRTSLRVFFSPLLLIGALLAFFFFDTLLLKNAIYYSIIGHPLVGEAVYLFALGSPFWYWGSGYIKGLWEENTYNRLWVFDMASSPSVDADEKEDEGDDTVRKTVKIQVFEMSDKVLSKFKIQDSGSLEKLEYAGNDGHTTNYMCRSIDLKNASIFPTWHRLLPPNIVLSYRRAILVNQKYLKDFVSKYRKIESLLPFLKEKQQDEIYQDMMDDMTEVFGKDIEDYTEIEKELTEELPDEPSEVGYEISREQLKEMGIEPPEEGGDNDE